MKRLRRHTHESFCGKKRTQAWMGMPATGVEWQWAAAPEKSAIAQLSGQ